MSNGTSYLNTYIGATGSNGGGALVTNKSTANNDYIIPVGENAFSVGPVTVASGVTITVSSGQRWLVL